MTKPHSTAFWKQMKLARKKNRRRAHSPLPKDSNEATTANKQETTAFDKQNAPKQPATSATEPSKADKDTEKQAESTIWTCSSCTLINELRVRRCAACGARRPPDNDLSSVATNSTSSPKKRRSRKRKTSDSVSPLSEKSLTQTSRDLKSNPKDDEDVTEEVEKIHQSIYSKKQKTFDADMSPLSSAEKASIDSSHNDEESGIRVVAIKDPRPESQHKPKATVSDMSPIDEKTLNRVKVQKEATTAATRHSDAHKENDSGAGAEICRADTVADEDEYQEEAQESMLKPNGYAREIDRLQQENDKLRKMLHESNMQVNEIFALFRRYQESAVECQKKQDITSHLHQELESSFQIFRDNMKRRVEGLPAMEGYAWSSRNLSTDFRRPPVNEQESVLGSHAASCPSPMESKLPKSNLQEASVQVHGNNGGQLSQVPTNGTPPTKAGIDETPPLSSGDHSETMDPNELSQEHFAVVPQAPRTGMQTKLSNLPTIDSPLATDTVAPAQASQNHTDESNTVDRNELAHQGQTKAMPFCPPTPRSGTKRSTPSSANSTQTIDPDQSQQQKLRFSLPSQLREGSRGTPRSSEQGESRRVTMGQADEASSRKRDPLNAPANSSAARKSAGLSKAPKSQPLATSTNRSSSGGWISNAPARQFMQDMDEAAGKASLTTSRPDAPLQPSWTAARPRACPATITSRKKPDALWEDESEPDYKYQETVRCKAKRQGLPCHDCSECRRFFQVLKDTGHEFSQDPLQYSRHRARHSPTETPADFWELDFIDERDKAAQDKADV